MNLAEIRAAEARLLLPTYERNPLHFVSGHGVWLTDAGGRDYLDLLSGIGVNALGYSHPAIEAAIAQQSRKLIHLSNLFFHEGQARLAEKLTQITGLDRAFFCNSGSESWEAALKLARAYAKLRAWESGNASGNATGPGTAAYKILALEHSFHGRTMGAISTTHKLKYREPYEPLVPGVEFIAFNDVEALKAKFLQSPSEICAVAIEVIQGEGGIHPVSREFLTAARALTQQSGAALIFDEIQSGVGRTGKWCSYQHYGIQPDITTLAKPLAGGLPLGAMLCSNEMARAMQPGLHGTTFGGGPLATAVALTVLETIEQEHLLEHVTAVGTYFADLLRQLAQRHEAILEVRGLGLMLGLEINSAETAKAVATNLLEHRIIINRTSETVLRFLPPFLLEREHIDIAIDALDRAFAGVGNQAQPHAAATREPSHEPVLSGTSSSASSVKGPAYHG